MTTTQRLQEAAHALLREYGLFNDHYGRDCLHPCDEPGNEHWALCTALVSLLQSERREAERETWEAAAETVNDGEWGTNAELEDIFLARARARTTPKGEP